MGTPGSGDPRRAERDSTVIIPTEQIKETVGFLYTHDQKDGKYIPLGTAFFTHVIENGKYIFNYIVTCKHVVKDCADIGEEIFLRLNNPIRLDVGYVNLPNRWKYHDDKSVDLAMMYWMPERKDVPVQWRSIPSDDGMVTNQRLDAIGHTLKVGDEVMFMGLFVQYDGYKRNFPIYRFGKIALITDEKINGEYGLSDYYLAECQGYPGNSGSPAYIELVDKDGGRAIFIVGMVAGFWPEQQVRQYGTTRVELYTHFGVTALVPFQKILDMLYGAEEMEVRKLSIERKEKKNAFKPASAKDNQEIEGVTKEEFEDVLKKIARPLTPEDEEKK